MRFGRYSDNNKTVEKVNRWAEADTLFKEQKYHNSIEAFFDYLRDDTMLNVVLERNGAEGRFQLFQGSKIVRGEFNNEHVQAEITLARMPQPSTPVMRRLLEMNFNLYYSRYALDGERLCMRFDTDIRTANPNKLYYGLKELAIKADKQDDLLVQEFSSLQTIDSEHIEEIPVEEKKIKTDFLKKDIQQTLDQVATLDADKFAGAISYLLLSLVFRIDYLVCPERKLLQDLEKVVDIYFKKDDKPTQERNQDMLDRLKKILAKKDETLYESLFRSKHTFAIVAPQNHKMVADAVNTAIQNMAWYRDNGYAAIANRVLEYGLTFTQFSYSLPKPLSDLIALFMQVNHADFFKSLGFAADYYDATANSFNSEAIAEKINRIVDEWRPKFPKLGFRTDNLQFDTLVSFIQSFSAEIANLNFDT